MRNEKKSFLIYFDNAPMINGLPPEQRGWLFSALLDYGSRVSRENLTSETALSLYPQLNSQTQMVFRFIASTIDRDTQRWLQRQRAGEERRRTRERGEAVFVCGFFCSDTSGTGGTGAPAPGAGIIQRHPISKKQACASAHACFWYK